MERSNRPEVRNPILAGMSPAPYRVHGSGYVARSSTFGVGAIRPTKSAAGMAFTISRAGRASATTDVMALIAWGTLDPLHRLISSKTVRPPCPCCGHKQGGKPMLNDSGRRRLEQLRQLRAERRRTSFSVC